MICKERKKDPHGRRREAGRGGRSRTHHSGTGIQGSWLLPEIRMTEWGESKEISNACRARKFAPPASPLQTAQGRGEHAALQGADRTPRDYTRGCRAFRGGVLRETASLPEQVASAGEVRSTSPPPHGAAATTAGSSCGLPAAISNPPGSQPDEQAATLGSGLLAERQGRGQGEASESVVSGVEFKGIPRNFTVVTSNAFNAVFQKSK